MHALWQALPGCGLQATAEEFHTAQGTHCYALLLSQAGCLSLCCLAGGNLLLHFPHSRRHLQPAHSRYQVSDVVWPPRNWRDATRSLKRPAVGSITLAASLTETAKAGHGKCEQRGMIRAKGAG